MSGRPTDQRGIDVVRERIVSASNAQAELLERASSNVAHLENLMDTQSVAMRDTAERLVRVLDEVTTGRAQVDALAHSVREVAALNAQLTEALRAVAAVEERVEAIREVTTDIRMLGLNAAIEAAHAGERGQGFAVVAASMQELARTGARVADEITRAVSEGLSQVETVATDAQSRIGQQSAVADRVSSAFVVVESEARAMFDATHGFTMDFEHHKSQAAAAQRELQDRMEASSGETASIIGLLTGSAIVDLTAHQADGRLHQFVVVDVRTAREWSDELGRLDGALHIPIADDDFSARLATLDRSAPTLFVCRSGGRSARGARLALQLGFREVYNLDGGMLAWNQARLPVVRPSLASAAA
jgi:rhodanese-related sulfurtransferase